MPRPKRTSTTVGKSVEALRHEEATRTNIPTAEYQSLLREEDESPVQAAYGRRNRDLDPQLVWRGKDEQDLNDLVVNVPPLYIQEKVHPKALVDDLRRHSDQWLVNSGERGGEKPSTNHSSLSTQSSFADLFADFNGLPEGADRTEFYQHDANWSNRMVLGDSLQVMASLSEREGLQGKVQCIYIDPPYGIKFNSNFQWSTTSRDVRDGNREHITREPEQVKAFRDTWRDGIHSYLTYLRDRLTVARDLLADSGSIFVQISDENLHRVRALMDEVFGEENFIVTIKFAKTAGLGGRYLDETFDYLLWYARKRQLAKFRRPYFMRVVGEAGARQYRFLMDDAGSYREADPGSMADENQRLFSHDNFTSQTASTTTVFEFSLNGVPIAAPRKGGWKSNLAGVERLKKAGRVIRIGATPRYVRYFDDAPYYPVGSAWLDTAISGFAEDKVFVVQTLSKVIERCILMTTDPGDLVLDPTCGSGTTAYVAEHWGRRWITVDTSRVALALARARIMGARYPYYLLADSRDGQLKEAELSRRAPSETPTYGNLRQGFVYERVPHITLRAIANNAEIDVIWEKYEEKLAPLRYELSVASGQWPVASGEGTVNSEGPGNSSLATSHSPLQEWEIPRERPDNWPPDTDHWLTEYWNRRIARQKEIDASIASHADYEYLYDKPYEDRSKVRVAGPFTVESITPHRVLGVDENGDIIDGIADPRNGYETGYDFGQVILDNLKRSGVQQAHKEDRITFTSLTPWPGRFVCAVGEYSVVSGQSPEGPGEEPDTDHQPLATAGIFIGPEFGTVSRPDLVEAAREAAECGFDVLIACAFNYDAHTTEFESLGRIPVLKARMNADLHMAGELKNTGSGNLFVIFGEPDISVVSDQWLVTSGGRMVANYDIIKELSGLGSLEEINGVGRDGLSNLCELSAGGAVRYDRPSQAGGGVSSGEYSGGGGASGEQGVSSVSGDSERVAGGDGDLSHSSAAVGDGHGGPSQVSDVAGVRGWKNAQRAKTLAAVQTLKDADFPLTLTTGHWTQITVNGVDVFHPNTGEVRSDGPEGIACWFIDTDYNEESFFVRHAYFLGAGDPYKSLKTTLRAEIDEDAWATLNSDTSRPFPKPQSGRIAVKVINHLGDEVMKVFRVD